MSHGRFARHLSSRPGWLVLVAAGFSLACAPGCQRSPFRRPNAVPEAATPLVDPQGRLPDTGPSAARSAPATADLVAEPVADKPDVPRPPTPLLDSAVAQTESAPPENEPIRQVTLPVDLPQDQTLKTVEEKSLGNPAPATAEPAPTIKVDRPADPAPVATPTPPRNDWPDGVAALRNLARQKSGEPGGVDDGWAIRASVLDWLAGDAPKPDDPRRAVWTSVLTALTTATSVETPQPSELSRTLRDAVEALETLAPLELADFRLCRKIEGYAVFEPVDPKALKAGRSVLLYCEVSGVRYEPADEAFHSRLAAKVELSPADGGEAVWSETLDAAEEFCRRRRRDYYVNYRITLPTTLAPGDYRLRLSLVDQISGQPATAEARLTLAP